MEQYKAPWSPAQCDLPKDPICRADIENVLEHGFVVLRDVFTKVEAEEAIAELRRIGGETPKPGRNAFEGLKTNRFYSLLNKYLYLSR